MSHHVARQGVRDGSGPHSKTARSWLVRASLGIFLASCALPEKALVVGAAVTDARHVIVSDINSGLYVLALVPRTAGVRQQG